MRFLAIAAGILCLGSTFLFPTNAAATATATAADLISFGPLEFLKSILVNAFGAPTLVNLQNNVFNLVSAVRSGNSATILDAVLRVADPNNVTRIALKILNNYDSHMWDASFRQQIGGVLKGLSTATSSGISCFSDGIRATLNNFTTSYVTAMDKIFVSNRPNSTAPPPTGFEAAPKAMMNTLRVLFDMLTVPEVRRDMVNGIRGVITSFQMGRNCMRGNMTDVTNSWKTLTAELRSGTIPTTTYRSFWG